MMLSGNGLKTLRVRRNELIEWYGSSSENRQDISRPFTPDEIVYCKSSYLFLNEEEPDQLLREAEKAIPSFEQQHGYQPKVMLIKGIGLIAAGDHARQCDIILDVFKMP